MSDHWTKGERKAARIIYDKALAAASADYLARHQAKSITTVQELFAYEFEIREWRKDFDSFFQFRDSTIDTCFLAALVRHWLEPEDIQGIGEERISKLISWYNSIPPRD